MYPIQLAANGQEWWECIQGRYEMQAAGMVAFIYVPTTVVFNLILFGATLFQRGIINEKELGMSSTVIILTCLVSTVISQEVLIPDVSTQRLFLPCEEPSAVSFHGVVVKWLDFSRYARIFLTSAFGMEYDPIY